MVGKWIINIGKEVWPFNHSNSLEEEGTYYLLKELATKEELPEKGPNLITN